MLIVIFFSEKFFDSDNGLADYRVAGASRLYGIAGNQALEHSIDDIPKGFVLQIAPDAMVKQ